MRFNLILRCYLHILTGLPTAAITVYDIFYTQSLVHLKNTQIYKDVIMVAFTCDHSSELSIYDFSFHYSDEMLTNTCDVYCLYWAMRNLFWLSITTPQWICSVPKYRVKITAMDIQ